MADVNPYVAELFKLANSFGTPLVQNLARQTSSNTPEALDSYFAERMRNNSLNGSGPSDPIVAAQSSPRTMLDQINGTIGEGTGDAARKASEALNQGGIVLLLGIAAIVALTVLYRRR